MAKFDDDKSFSSQESDGRNFSFYLTKMENELFDEKKHQAHSSWNIKRKESKKCGVHWIVFKNQDVIFEVFQRQLSKKDVDFLNKNIILFLTWVKEGLNSVVKLKEKIKQFKNRDL